MVLHFEDIFKCNTQIIYISCVAIITILFYFWSYYYRYTVPPESRRSACILMICLQIIGYSIYVLFHKDTNQYVWLIELGLIFLLCMTLIYSFMNEHRDTLHDEYTEVI